MRKHWFNKAVYTTWLRRYWPGAALMTLVYLVAAIVYNGALVQLLSSPAYAGAPQPPMQLATFITNNSNSGPLVLFSGGCGWVAALLCSSYLQAPASAGMLHSLPLRRSALLFSTAAAGLSLLAAPIVLSGIFFAVVMLGQGVLSLSAVLLYILVMFLCAAFLFALTMFSAMLSGHSIAAGLFAAGVLLGPLALESLVYSYCQRYLFGFTGLAGDGMALVQLNPLYRMASWLGSININTYARQAPPLWPALLFVALIALCFAAAALVYRRRQLEHAGDVVAVKPMRPVFRIGMAVLGAVLFSLLSRRFFVTGPSVSFGMDLCLGLVGGALGYFAAEMFLRRSVKVLHCWKGALAVCLAYALLLTGLYADVPGYGSRQLAAEDVEFIVVSGIHGSVYAAMQGDNLYPYSLPLGVENPAIAAYREEVAQTGNRELPLEMTPDVAEAILQQDATVLKGENLATAVAFQNQLAAASRELMALQRQYSQVNYYPTDTAVRYYTVPLMAKMKDGSLFYRNYTLLLPPSAYTEIQAALSEVYRLERIGWGENMLRAAPFAQQVDLHFNSNLYTGAHSVWTLNAGEWEGLFEAYLADVNAQPAAAVPGYTPLDAEPANTLVDAYMNFGAGQQEYITLEITQKNTMRWLVEQGLLSEEELAAARARAVELGGGYRNVPADDGMITYVF